MSPLSLNTLADEEDFLPPLDLVREVLEEAGTVARLLEILYLIREPGLLDIMRRIGALSDEDRDRLLAYLNRHVRHDVKVRDLPGGALTFETRSGESRG